MNQDSRLPEQQPEGADPVTGSRPPHGADEPRERQGRGPSRDTRKRGRSSSSSEDPPLNKRAAPRHSSASSSGSEHTSDSSSQDSADRQRRKSSKGKRTKSDKAAKQGKTKGSKRGKDKRNRSSKDKRKKMHKRSKEKGPVQLSEFINEGNKERYSSVSGKKIKMKLTKTAEDLEAERRRKALLSNLNSFYE